MTPSTIVWNSESRRDLEAMTLRVQEKFIEGLLWFKQRIAYRQDGYK